MEAGAPLADGEYVERATNMTCQSDRLKLSVQAAVAAKKRFGLLSDTTANRDFISTAYQRHERFADRTLLAFGRNAFLVPLRNTKQILYCFVQAGPRGRYTGPTPLIPQVVVIIIFKSLQAAAEGGQQIPFHHVKLEHCTCETFIQL